MVKITLLSLFAFFILVGCTTEKKSVVANHVIVIGVDGLSPNGINTASTPNIDRLIKGGASTMHARSVLPTSSSPNWSSMIMGAGPEQTGITSNDWRINNYTLPPSAKDAFGYFPNIFSEIERQKPELEVGAIYHWTGFENLFPREAVDFDTTLDNEVLTTQKVVEYLTEKNPNFLFVQYDNVDGAGHKYGHGTNEYYNEVSYTDSLIGIVLDAVEKSSIANGVVIMLCADHGGIGYGHGGESLDEMAIPYIFYGLPIKQNYTINHAVYQYDNAAMAAYLLGLEIPVSWTGKPVKSAVIGNPDMNDQQFSQPIEAPVFSLHNGVQGYPGGLFRDSVEVVLGQHANSSIYYTTDGSMPDENSTIYSESFTIKETKVIKAISVNENNTSDITTAYYRISQQGNPNQGLAYKVYKNNGKDWTKLPAVDAAKPNGIGYSPEFTLKNVMNSKENQTAVYFSGYLYIEEADDYDFYLRSDDGAKLLVNGSTIIDNDGEHGIKEKKKSVQLDKGYHTIELNYFNAGGSGWVDVLYGSSSLPKQIVPATVLYHKI